MCQQQKRIRLQDDPEGDHKSIATRSLRYYERIRHYILSKTDLTCAEDLTQDVFVEFCQKNEESAPIRDSKAYLYGIARKRLAQHFRRKNSEPVPISIEDYTNVPAPGPSDADQELVNRIRKLSSKLPPKTREALHLHYFQGLPIEEAALRSGCTRNTFYQRLYMGIRALRTLVHNTECPSHTASEEKK